MMSYDHLSLKTSIQKVYLYQQFRVKWQIRVKINSQDMLVFQGINVKIHLQRKRTGPNIGQFDHIIIHTIGIFETYLYISQIILMII